MNRQESAAETQAATGAAIGDGDHPERGPSDDLGPAGGKLLETVEICTGEDPTAAVVWLHGLGADGHDFEPIVPALNWPGAPDMRFVFPHAPIRPVTVNGGMRMRAWYDILSLSSDRGHDEHGVVQSVNSAARLLRREHERGIPFDRIVVAGFSQGGAIALQLALRYPQRLCGLIVLSTYMLFGERLERQRHSANLDIPVFGGHGAQDPVVTPDMGQDMMSQLKSLDYAVQWHTYPMPHAVCPEEITHIRDWLQDRLR
jgi:phospholipase/carboxylesterase